MKIKPQYTMSKRMVYNIAKKKYYENLRQKHGEGPTEILEQTLK
jgi:hypothetical protein